MMMDYGDQTPTKNIVVMVSGGGTNLQALIDAEQNGLLRGGRLKCVISSKADAYAMERAKKANIPTRVIQKKDFSSPEKYTEVLCNAIFNEYADLIVLAGYMNILDEKFIRHYRNRIINIHPSLIPSFCGKGFYGLHVHEAVLESGVKITGATVHFVNEEPDGGPIILQKAVNIEQGDTPEILQKRVMEQAEWKLLPEAVNLFCQGKIKITRDGKKTVILK